PGGGGGIVSGIARGKRYVSRGEARVEVEGSQSPGDGDRRKRVMEAAGKVAERMVFPDSLLGDRMAPDYGKPARYDCVLQREFRTASGTFELAVTSGDPEVSFEYATAILNWFKEDVTGNQELWPLSVRIFRQPVISREAEPVWQWPQIASRAAVLAGSSAVAAFLILLGRWRAKQPRCTALPEPAEY
ncbi:MAG TPA: hypothetical protein VG796_14075, partial [Verrucomicrobiales bacterium]|nr:hypothetical protein [Verrucomicrobiales bacterium]